jgi:uncharacterized protein
MDDAGRRAQLPVETWKPAILRRDRYAYRPRRHLVLSRHTHPPPELVRLFSTILRKDAQGYVLVTPAEKVGITVEDAPFTAVELAIAEQGPSQRLRFRTNVDDWIEASASHPLRFETAAFGGLKPYIQVRGELWALVVRALTFDLVNLGEIGEHDGARYFGVHSAGHFFFHSQRPSH